MSNLRVRVFLLALAAIAMNAGIASGAPGWIDRILDVEDTLPYDPASPATIVFRSVDIEFKKKETELRGRTAVRINLPSGILYAAFAEAIYPGREMKKMKGWHWDGKELRDLDRESLIEFGHSIVTGIYTEARILMGVFPEAGTGDLVFHEYELEDRDTSHLTQVLTFPEPCQAHEVRVRVEVPGGWELSQQATHTDEWTLSRDGRESLLTGENWPARPAEALAPSSLPAQREIWLACHDPSSEEDDHHGDWASVARNALEIFEAPSTPGERVHDRVAALTGHLETDTEKIDALCGFVQDEIRYVGIEIGKGRWVPRDSDASLYNRYADCKDKTALLRAMLREIGVRSSPVLVRTSSPVLENVPSPFQFDHCIVGIARDDRPFGPESTEATLHGWLLFDPTDPVTPLGFLPRYLEGNIVMIAADAIPLHRVGRQQWWQRSRTYRAVAEMEDDGSVLARVRIEETGSLGLETQARVRVSSTRELIEALEHDFRPALSDPDIRQLRFETSGDTCRTLLVVHGRKTLTLGRTTGTFAPGLFPVLDIPAFPDSARIRPVRLDDPVLVQARVEWQLPAGWESQTVGTLAHAELEGTRFVSTAEWSDGTAVWGWSYQQDGAQLQPGRMDDVRAFLDQVGAYRETPLLFTTGPGR